VHTVTPMRPDRFALALGIVALFAWPLSYAWVPTAGHNPDWIDWVVPLAEWGAIACAVGAIWLGLRSRRAGMRSLAATWAPRVGLLTLGLMAISAFLVFPAFYRDA
jgi:hypothetical protein